MMGFPNISIHKQALIEINFIISETTKALAFGFHNATLQSQFILHIRFERIRWKPMFFVIIGYVPKLYWMHV